MPRKLSPITTKLNVAKKLKLIAKNYLTGDIDKSETVINPTHGTFEVRRGRTNF